MLAQFNWIFWRWFSKAAACNKYVQGDYDFAIFSIIPQVLHDPTVEIQMWNLC